MNFTLTSEYWITELSISIKIYTELLSTDRGPWSRGTVEGWRRGAEAVDWWRRGDELERNQRSVRRASVRTEERTQRSEPQRKKIEALEREEPRE